MTHVTAVLTGDDDTAVGTAADDLAGLLGAGVAPMHPPTDGRQERVDAVVAALGRRDVVAAALSVAAPDELCWDLLPRVETPLLVLPRRRRPPTDSVTRILVPLDGTERTASGLRGIADRLVSGGADLVAVHVFVPDTVPAFWDQAAHSQQPWRAEFLRRNLPGARDLGLRRGEPVAQVLAAVAESDVDLLLLGWSQNLDAGHARIVREALTHGSVPVLLVRTADRP